MPNVMVVDDEISVRRALRKVLERGKLDVVEAGSAAEALGLLDNGTEVDAVVIDVMMPGMSGLVFYDELLARSPRLAHRVVFLTGAARDPRVLAPIEQRGVPLISKLDDFALVLDAVRLAILKERQ